MFSYNISRQILGLNPQLRGLLDSNPQLREMMQNPEFLRQLSSPETMQVNGIDSCDCHFNILCLFMFPQSNLIL